jgi:indolepyruvate ferredoxin oxidoreductase alpha subunit
MTGHQENPGTGKHAAGDPAYPMDIETIVKALGIKNVWTINPNDLNEVRKALDSALAIDDPSVIITRWPCALKRMSQEEKDKYGNPFTAKYKVDEGKCIGCRMCIRCGCPAISMDNEKKKSVIDLAQCVGCGVCSQVCPKKAIEKQ